MTIDYQDLTYAGITEKTYLFGKNASGLGKKEQKQFIADINFISENITNYTKNDFRQPLTLLYNERKDHLAAMIFGLKRIEELILQYPQHILGIQNILAAEFAGKYQEVYPLLMQNIATQINQAQLSAMQNAPMAILGLYYNANIEKKAMLMSAYFDSIVSNKEYSSLQSVDQQFIMELLQHSYNQPNLQNNTVTSEIEKVCYDKLPEEIKIKIKILQDLNIANQIIATELSIPVAIASAQYNYDFAAAKQSAQNQKSKYQLAMENTFTEMIDSGLGKYGNNPKLYTTLYEFAAESLFEDEQISVLSAYGNAINHEYTEENLECFSNNPAAITQIYINEKQEKNTGVEQSTFDLLSKVHNECIPAEIRNKICKGSNIYKFFMQNSAERLAEIVADASFLEEDDVDLTASPIDDQSIEEGFADLLPPEVACKLLNVADEIEAEKNTFKEIFNTIKKYLQKLVSLFFGNKKEFEPIKKDLKEVFTYLQQQQTNVEKFTNQEKNNAAKKIFSKKTESIKRFTNSQPKKRSFTEHARRNSGSLSR